MNQKAFFFLLLAGLFLTACGNQPAEQQDANTATAEAEAPEVASAWDQAMEAYHDVMSGTFHPAEEGDLAPLKERSGELAKASAAWAALPVPEVHAGKGLESMMSQLQTGSAAIGELVQQGASDEELTEAIVALHDVFHGIVGACREAH